MIEKQIEIIEECLRNPNKFNLYMSFYDENVTIEPALALKKYYLWYLKRIAKINLPTGKEKDYFLGMINENTDYIIKIMCNYSLGEIYAESNLFDEAEKYFNEVVNRSKEFENYDLTGWAKKNLSDITDSAYKIPMDNIDILSFENNYAVFKKYKNERHGNPASLMDKAAYLLCKNCPTYRQSAKLVLEYYKNKYKWYRLIEYSSLAYKKTKDNNYIKYIIYGLKGRLQFCINERYYLKDDECEDFIEILNDQLYSLNMGLWSDFIESFYPLIEKNKLEILLSYIDNVFKYTQIFTGEFKGLGSLMKIIKLLYEDIIKYRNQYEFIEKYEKNITKYLLYISSQNNAIEEAYEAYTKLKAYNNLEYDVSSALKNMNEPKIDNIDKLSRIKNYPFAELLKEFKLIVEDADFNFANIDKAYMKNKSAQSKIMIYGIFASGKSAFINSILGENLLEVGDLPTTSAITFVACDKDENQSQILKEDMTFSRVFINNDFLKENNIIFIDTPGFEDPNLERGQLASDNLDICDGLIILLDASKPLSNSELNKIKALKDVVHHSNFLFIVNKIDYIDEDELDDVMEYIQSNLIKIFGQGVKVYPYSSYIVKTGNSKLKEDICLAIKNMIPKNEADNRWKSVSDTLYLEKNRIISDINKKNEEINNKIKNIEIAIDRIENSEKIAKQILEDYINKFTNDIKILENQINKYIEDNIRDIFDKNSYIVHTYNYVDTIHNDVRTYLQKKINQWGDNQYKAFVSEKINLFIRNINPFIIDKNSLLKSIALDIKESTHNLYELKNTDFSEELESRKLIIDLIKNCSILLKSCCISVDSLDMGINEPPLGSFSKAISKIWNGESNALENYKTSILNQLKRASEVTTIDIKKSNKKLELLIDTIKKSILGENAKTNHYNKSLYIVKFDDISTEESNSELESKNIKVIKDYKNEIENVLKNIINIKNKQETKLEELNCFEENLTNKANVLKIELLKYKNQIDRGVIYCNGKVYRTN